MDPELAPAASPDTLVPPLGGHLVGFTDAEDRIQEIATIQAVLDLQHPSRGPGPGPDENR